MTEPTRADDEQLLRWLEGRRAGVSLQALARAAGCVHSTVDKRTRPVLDADLAESGEDPRQIARFYWRGKVPGRRRCA